MNPVQDAIVRAAQEAGVDPNWALSVAERESNFDPNARASKTIQGVFQMTRGLRNQYGIGDSSDPYTQAQGFMKYQGDLKSEMAKVLGRDPTPNELYAGHHFGGVRAARLINANQGDTPVQDVFTRQEMEGNPHFAKAGTIGNLLDSVYGDMDKRYAKYSGGEVPQSSTAGMTASAAPTGQATSKGDDWGIFGSSVKTPEAPMGDVLANMSNNISKSFQQSKDLQDMGVEGQPETEKAIGNQQKMDQQNQQMVRGLVAKAQREGSGIPQLPSISKPIAPPPDAVLQAKPGDLTSALLPMMGRA